MVVVVVAVAVQLVVAVAAQLVVVAQPAVEHSAADQYSQHCTAAVEQDFVVAVEQLGTVEH